MAKDESSVEHYGVPGMKWGKRTASGSNTKGSIKSLHKESTDSAEAKVLRKKKPSQLSNQEMQKLVTRLNLEQQYARLNPTAQSKGQKIALDILTKVGNKTVEKIADKAVTMAVAAGFDAVMKKPVATK